MPIINTGYDMNEFTCTLPKNQVPVQTQLDHLATNFDHIFSTMFQEQ